MFFITENQVSGGLWVKVMVIFGINIVDNPCATILLKKRLVSCIGSLVRGDEFLQSTMMRCVIE